MTRLEILTSIADGVSEMTAIEERAHACAEHLKELMQELAECQEGEEP